MEDGEPIRPESLGAEVRKCFEEAIAVS